MRVGVERGASWSATPPSMIVKEGYFTVPGGNPGRTYDVSPGGERFLVIKQAATDAGAAPPGIVVVQHWDEELKAKVPAQ
jgi:hypothetical protein